MHNIFKLLRSKFGLVCCDGYYMDSNTDKCERKCIFFFYSPSLWSHVFITVSQLSYSSTIQKFVVIKLFFYRHMYVVIISNKVFFLTFSKFKLLFWQLRHKGNNPWHFLSIKKIKMEVPFFVEIVFQKFPNKWAHYVSNWLSRYHDEAQ